LKRPQEAEAAFHQALESRRKLADDFPSVLEYRRDLAGGIENLGQFLKRQGKNAAALEPFRQSLELRKAIVKQAGPVPDYRRELAKTSHNVAWALSVTGPPGEAESACRSALDLWQQLAVELPEEPDIQYGLAVTLANLGKLCNQRREFKAAVTLLESARMHVQATLDKRPNDRRFRGYYRDGLVALAESWLELADHAKVAAIAEEILRFDYEPARDTYGAGCLLARCVPLADKDATLPQAKRKELAQSYSQQAMALLHQAVTKGFKDVALMKKDSDLDSVRSREEFRRLIADLEASSGKSRTDFQLRPDGTCATKGWKRQLAGRRNDGLFTPKWLHNAAQGKRSAALGKRVPRKPNPEGVVQDPGETRPGLCNPFRVGMLANRNPRVAEAASQGCGDAM
jgi:tetratricopeptide (TPR) repeat protein